MSYQRERERFIARYAAELGYETCTSLLRQATTLHRLAEAQCNGDYPCDNAERETAPCPRCGSGYVPSVIKRGVCPDCRAVERVGQLLLGTAYQPYLQGDPRGLVLQLAPATATLDDMDRGRVPMHGVPVQSRSARIWGGLGT